MLSGPSPFSQRVTVAVSWRPFAGGVGKTPAVARSGVIADQLRDGWTVRPGLLPAIPAEELLGVAPLRIDFPLQRARVPAIGEGRQDALAKALALQRGSDANILQSFAPGQGIVSGQAVRFPLLVKVDHDADLVSQRRERRRGLHLRRIQLAAGSDSDGERRDCDKVFQVGGGKQREVGYNASI